MPFFRRRRRRLFFSFARLKSKHLQKSKKAEKLNIRGTNIFTKGIKVQTNIQYTARERDGRKKKSNKKNKYKFMQLVFVWKHECEQQKRKYIGRRIIPAFTVTATNRESKIEMKKKHTLLKKKLNGNEKHCVFALFSFSLLRFFSFFIQLLSASCFIFDVNFISLLQQAT